MSGEFGGGNSQGPDSKNDRDQSGLQGERERTIQDAVNAVLRLVEDGRLSEKYMLDLWGYELGNPDEGVLEEIRRAMGPLKHDRGMEQIVQDRLRALKREEDEGERFKSLAETIARVHNANLPRMSEGADRPRRMLQIGIKARDLGNVISALGSLGVMSDREIEQVRALAMDQEKVGLLFLMIDDFLRQWEVERQSAAF